MKVHRISKSLLGLFIAYFIVFAYSYGRFLQIPIFPNEVILWKSVFEQLTSWIPPVIAYCLLFVAIAKNGQRRANAAKTNMLALLASFILIFLLAFSIGIHAAAQMVEDFIIEQRGTTLFQFVWFFDEYVGHTFLLFLSMLLGLLAYFELGTKPQNSSKIDLRITELMGLLNGSLWGGKWR